LSHVVQDLADHVPVIVSDFEFNYEPALPIESIPGAQIGAPNIHGELSVTEIPIRKLTNLPPKK
jgi:hypothetical protein